MLDVSHLRHCLTTHTITIWHIQEILQNVELKVSKKKISILVLVLNTTYVLFFPPVGEVSLDLDALMATKSGAVKALTSGIAMLFKNNKVRVI